MSSSPQSFAALRQPGFAPFLLGTTLTMLADNVEHVISYWVIFQKFQSPALGGFAVISHWLPFLLLSIYVGTLADRFDARRLIQIGGVLFMGVSIAWAALILTDTLQMWHAMVLLVCHGIAGVLWTVPSQLLIHDVVGAERLQSAVRLMATGRYLGMLVGPAVGSALMLALGPDNGLFVNALIYLPLLIWLMRAPYGRRKEGAPPSSRLRGLSDVAATFGLIRVDRVLLSMTLLVAAASLLIGNSYQAQMPGFAEDLGRGDPGLAYGMLLAADAAGALCAGLVLESRGLLRPTPRTAFVLAVLWCCSLGSFALMGSYVPALTLLFAAGFFELSFNSSAQTLVQLRAPAAVRGRILGVYSMAALGMRMFSGITVGLVGGLIGIHLSLALSAAVLTSLIIGLALSLRRGARTLETSAS